MRIAVVNHTPVGGSGSGTYVATLATGLARRGHDVCVVTPQADAYPLKGVQQWPVMVDQHFPSFTGHPLSLRTYDSITPDEAMSLEALWTATFQALARNWRPDVIHVQHIWSVAKSAVAAGFRPVVTCHGSELDAVIRNHKSSTMFIPDLTELGAIIVISDYVYRRATAVFGPKLRAVVLPNPCDTEVFYPPSVRLPGRNPLLGFVGRLVAYKRCELFLEGLAELRTRSHAVTGVVIGDGPLSTVLRQHASDLGLGRAVVFTGQIAQGELPGWYAQMDALVVPSHNEPFGLVALEAVACGTRAVVAAEGGLLELAHPPFVIAVDVTSADELGLTLCGVLSHTPKHVDAIEGYEWVRNTFSLDRYLTGLEAIYRLNYA